MKYAYFPGCSLESTAWDFDLSTRAVCRQLGIELEEIPNWVCCGSTPAHSSNASLAVALPVMNLQKAQAMGRPVLTACASCYARLRTANHLVRNETPERQRAERVTGKPYDGEVEVLHVLDVLVNCFGLDRIRHKVQQPLAGLRVACYYGCLLTRPPDVVAFDNAENPTCMDELVAALGAEPVVWPYKTECCGASLSITRSNVVERLGRRLLLMARQAGAAASWWPVPCASSIWICGSRMRPRAAKTCPQRRSSISRSFWALPWESRPSNWGWTR